ncbi:MAG: CCA tRNA nucleotidyltransferase [Planctomycetes bacterium]|nr:CCA tRNA nucleotidyltransferase [Planctomycetota bacterium]
MQDLSGALAGTAREIAERAARRGARIWIVGGAVRDLALGRPPKDVDMASALLPDEIEELFPQTIPVGKAFGTILIVQDGLAVEHTTFRSETGYSDRRRPDRVEFGHSVEEDSTRRDFTCNALYLDPLRDDFADPQRGLADLEQATLRCVGDPLARFREDGLRLVRMARFAGALGLEPAPGMLEAAIASRATLAGVAPERVLRELERIFARPGHARAIELFARAGLAGQVFPGLVLGEERLWAFDRLPDAPGLECGLALLFGGDRAAGEKRLEELRVSRETRQRVLDAWSCLDDLRDLDGTRRARRVRLERRPGFEIARRVAGAKGFDRRLLDQLAAEKLALGPEGLRPSPWLRSKDLEAAGVPKGPRWRELLDAAEEAQLDQRITSVESALDWLRARLGQDGGNT